MLTPRSVVRLLLILMLLAQPMITWACVICDQGNGSVSTVQLLQSATAVVLAKPSINSINFEVTEVVKKNPVQALPKVLVGSSTTPAPTGKLRLYYQDGESSRWESVGWVGAEQVNWLKQLMQQPVRNALSNAKSLARTQFFLSRLEHADGLLAQIAFEELSSTPYGLMRKLRPELTKLPLAQWIVDPTRHSRRSLLLLLWGMTATEKDVPLLQNQLFDKQRIRIKGEHSAIVAALLEIQGNVGLDWLEKNVFLNEARATALGGTAVLALSVHGNDGGRLSKEQILAFFKRIIKQRPALAGLFAPDLAQWERWEFGLQFTDILSRYPDIPFSLRYPLILYLHRSPLPQAKTALENLQKSGAI